MNSILFIYTKADENDVMSILNILVKNECLEVKSQNSGIIYGESDYIVTDSAIIWVSDDATKSSEWQKAVRNVHSQYRLIPVGGTQEVDYNDPNIIPPNIEKLNFISVEKKCAQNIWEALITEEQFYDLKNQLLSETFAWEASGESETFLRLDRKQIKKDIKTVQDQLTRTSGEHSKKQLERILIYLRQSKKYAFWNLLEKIFRVVRLGVIAVALSLVIVLFLQTTKKLVRLQNSSVLLVSPSTADTMTAVAAIRTLDGITNSTVSDELRSTLGAELIHYLDEEWCNTPVGNCYKWALNSGVMYSDNQTLLTADGGGNIIKWDFFSGAVISKERITDDETMLITIGLSSDENKIIAADKDGYLYIKAHGDNWIRSAESFPVPASAEVHTVCENNQVLIFGAGKLLLFDITDCENPILVYNDNFDNIYSASIDQDAAIAIVSENESLKELRVNADGLTSEMNIPVSEKNNFTGDFLEGTFILSDENGRILFWDSNEQQVINTSILSENPLSAAFINANTIVVNDRNSGNSIYDRSSGMNLGSVLDEAPAISTISAAGTTVYGYNAGAYYSENVELLLPQQMQGQVIKHEGTKESTDKVIRNIEIAEDGTVNVLIAFDGQEPVEYQLIDSKNWNGRACVAAITNNGNSFVIATDRGYMFEMSFTSDGAGAMETAHRQLGMKSKITAIYETEDGYLAEDGGGRLWYLRSGEETLFPNGMIKAVKEKLTSAVSDDLIDIISDDLAKELELQLAPGHDGEEWE